MVSSPRGRSASPSRAASSSPRITKRTVCESTRNIYLPFVTEWRLGDIDGASTQCAMYYERLCNLRDRVLFPKLQTAETSKHDLARSPSGVSSAAASVLHYSPDIMAACPKLNSPKSKNRVKISNVTSKTPGSLGKSIKFGGAQSTEVERDEDEGVSGDAVIKSYRDLSRVSKVHRYTIHNQKKIKQILQEQDDEERRLRDLPLEDQPAEQPHSKFQLPAGLDPLSSWAERRDSEQSFGARESISDVDLRAHAHTFSCH